jgi:hypothetical protein
MADDLSSSNKCFDLYWIDVDDIDTAKTILEKLLEVEMKERYSDYTDTSYKYFVRKSEEIALYCNAIYWDEQTSLLQPDFPQAKFIAHTCGFSPTDADHYKSLLLACKQIIFLKRQIW